jgi:hypothetical protein
MSENSFSDKAMLIVSVSLMVLVLAGFAWVWFGTARPGVDQFTSTADLEPVSISGVESKAKTLLDGLKNNSGIPIPEPTAKMGRPDPFANL